MSRPLPVCRAFWFGCVLLSVVPIELAGQSWSLETTAGQVRYNISSPVNTRGGSFGIRFNQERRNFQTTIGLPFSNQDLSWGVLEFSDRFAKHRGGLVAGVDVSALAHGQRDPVAAISGRGIVAELLPTVSHNVGSGVFELRSGPRWYAARLGDTKWTRRLWTTDIRGTFEPTSGLRLGADVRHDRGGEGESYTRPGLSFTAALGRAAVNGSVGVWTGDIDNNDLEWGGGVSFPIKPRLWLVSAVRHDTFDPTFLSLTRTSWSAGLNFQIGRPREERIPTVDERHETTRVVLRLELQDSSGVPCVAGDFTRWKRVRMNRYEHEWRFSADLPPGVYYFAFCTQDGKWFVPPGTPNRVTDGMGGFQASVIVH